MDKAEESTIVTSPAEAAPTTPAENPAALTPPAPTEAPKIDMPRLEASMKSDSVEPPQVEIAKDETVHAPAAGPLAGLAAQWNAVRTHRYAPLAAAAAVAAVLGIGVGSATTAVLSSPPAPVAAAPSATLTETRALRDTVARLGSELATVKASVDNGHKSASTQFGKIADRLDRAEKAQAEPSAKLAKIADAIDRLERRPAATPAPAVVASAQPSDITNSIPSPEKKMVKPQVLEGWTVVEFGNNRAVLENRNGGIFEVGPGSNLPGVGKIEAIKRDDGRVVVSTARGIIVSMVEPRPRPMPYYAPRY